MQVPAPLVNAGHLLPVLQDKVDYGLNVHPLPPDPKIHVLKPNPPFDDIWGWGLWVISGYKGGALMMELVPSKQEKRKGLHLSLLSTM